MENQHDLYMMLGRMDGKIDSLMAMNSNQSKVLDDHAGRINALETEVASVKASSTTGKHWLGTAIAILALLLTLFTSIQGILPHG